MALTQKSIGGNMVVRKPRAQCFMHMSNIPAIGRELGFGCIAMDSSEKGNALIERGKPGRAQQGMRPESNRFLTNTYAEADCGPWGERPMSERYFPHLTLGEHVLQIGRKVIGDERWKAKEVGEKTHGDSEQKRKCPWVRADQISGLGSRTNR